MWEQLSKDKEASKDSKTINVGTEGTYAPFSFHDKDGKLTGYDIDVIKAVAKEEGLKLKFNETLGFYVCRFRRRAF